MFTTFEYNNVKSKDDLGLTVVKIKHLGTSEKDVEKVHVLGRSGDLLIDNNSYQNKIIEVEAVIREEEQAKLNDVATKCRRYLQLPSGYNKLIISEDPDWYYEATCINTLDIEEVINRYATAKFVFDCKPFKKSITGEDKIVINQKGTVIENPSFLASEPYIKVYGTGDVTIYIGDQELELKNVSDYIEIDSEMMNCFKDIYNQNSKMYSDFPTLLPGENPITWTGTVNKIEIIGRWRAL